MSAAHDLTDHYKQVRKRLFRAMPVRVEPKLLSYAKIYDAPIGPKIPQWEIDRRRVLAAKAVRDSQAIANAVAPMVQPSSPQRVRRIVMEVCEKHNVSPTEICSEHRSQRIVVARMEACYRLRKETTWSLPRIGKFLGGRDHTTILHGVRKHAARNGLPL